MASSRRTAARVILATSCVSRYAVRVSSSVPCAQGRATVSYRLRMERVARPGSLLSQLNQADFPNLDLIFARMGISVYDIVSPQLDPLPKFIA